MDGVTANDLKPQTKVPEGTKPAKNITKIAQEPGEPDMNDDFLEGIEL